DRQEDRYLGRCAQALGSADAREVQAVEPLEAQPAGCGRRGRRRGGQDEREEQRRAAHERACGLASATSMIKRCSSWATVFTEPGLQNVSPSLSVRRSPISSIGYVAVS